jgi:hypothetical protein
MWLTIIHFRRLHSKYSIKWWSPYKCVSHWRILCNKIEFHIPASWSFSAENTPECNYYISVSSSVFLNTDSKETNDYAHFPQGLHDILLISIDLNWFRRICFKIHSVACNFKIIHTGRERNKWDFWLLQVENLPIVFQLACSQINILYSKSYQRVYIHTEVTSHIQHASPWWWRQR